MARLGHLSLLLAGTILATALCAQEPEEPPAPQLDPQAEAHVQEILKTLPEGTLLRDALEDGQRGDGKRRPWMDGMRREGVMVALFGIQFRWDRGPKKFQVERMKCLEDYAFQQEDFLEETALGSSVQISGKLDQALRKAAIRKARESLALWMKWQQRTRGEGRAFVMLFDDEWLPSLAAPYYVDDPDMTELSRVVRMCGVPWDGVIRPPEYFRGERNPYPPPAPGVIEHSHRLVEATVEKLLAAGANVHAKDQQGETALLLAAGDCTPKVIRALLDAGANVNAKNRAGTTPLIRAAGANSLEQVRMLLEAGASVNARSEDVGMALFWALWNKNRQMLNDLITAGADVNAEEDRGWTVLMQAAYRAPSLVPILLAAGADMNSTDKRGSTGLMVATYYGNPQAVKALIEAGADVNVRNKEGATALSIAMSKGFPGIADILKQAGAAE